MAIGLIGRKCGMTRIFTEAGDSVPVTAIEVTPNFITQLKTEDNDGYYSIQVSSGQAKLSRVSKPLVAHYAKAGVQPGDNLREYRLTADQLEAFKVGDQLKVDLFEVGQKVDVTGTSKGKGFAGTVKRHNFRTQDMTHGNSKAHRKAGSIGQNQDPGKVFKGKKMAGQMGNVKTTVQSLEVVRVDAESNVILIKGSVPGATGGRVIIMPATKHAAAN